jgi:hypothetical protein
MEKQTKDYLQKGDLIMDRNGRTFQVLYKTDDQVTRSVARLKLNMNSPLTRDVIKIALSETATVRLVRVN